MDRLIHLSAIVGSIALILEMIVILIDVIGRAFGSPLLGSQDLVTMIMVSIVFGGMAMCDRNGGHISIDLFERYASVKTNRMIDAFSALLGAIIFLMIAWTVYESAKLSLMLNLSTNLLNIPKAWFQWALCAFSLITPFGMTLRAIELTFHDIDVRKEDRIP